MIDYEKLMLAHELAEKLDRNIYYAYKNNEGNYVAWVSLDQLLLEMKEINKPDPKYKVGQQVFLLGVDIIDSFIIDEIIIEKDIWYLSYVKDGGFMDEERSFNQYREDALYSSKQALIEAQLDYWYDLWEKNNPNISGDAISNKYRIPTIPDIQSCQHETHFGVMNELGNTYITCFDCHKVLSEECKHENIVTGAYSRSDPPKKCDKCGVLYR